MDSYSNHRHAQMAALDSDNDMPMHTKLPPAPVVIGHRSHSSRTGSMQLPHPKPPLTPNTSSMPQPMANPLLPSAPASPPTPAPSPTPHQRPPSTWRLTSPDDGEDPILEDARRVFCRLSIVSKENWLRSLVDDLDSHTLSFLHHLVSPRLKKDPFKALPNELCFRVCL